MLNRPQKFERTDPWKRIPFKEEAMKMKLRDWLHWAAAMAVLILILWGAK